jgi:tRNA-splicing ligase RtcB
MIELQGKYNTAKVFTDNVDEKAIGQIIEMLNEEFTAGSTIRIMPDTHAGAGCVIGTTMTIKDKVVPNLVGVDIGCGMFTTVLGDIDIDFKELDIFIRNNIPHGFNVHNEEKKFPLLDELKCKSHIDMNRALRSIGTLGGGNHFIEVNIDSKGNKYLVIHSGSRYLGLQVAKYYQDLAYNKLSDNVEDKEALIQKLKAEGREKEIQSELKKIKPKKVNKDLAYLEGQDLYDYLHDMDIAQKYAEANRIEMMNDILTHLKLERQAHIFFSTIHNFIDISDMTLRKGAISAKAGERVLIPINMRDGSILAIGKGNPDWNYSAPHGAGRLFSRGKAKENFKLEDYKETMKDIYTTSVSESTLDECPMAYKPIEEIIENTRDTIDIIDIIRPLYNFKA